MQAQCIMHHNNINNVGLLLFTIYWKIKKYMGTEEYRFRQKNFTNKNLVQDNVISPKVKRYLRFMEILLFALLTTSLK